MTEILGYLILLVSVAGVGYLLFFRRKKILIREVTLAGFGIIAGLSLALAPRLSELELFSVARLKLYQQASTDAKIVGQIRKDIEATSIRIGSLENQASEYLVNIEKLQEKTKEQFDLVSGIASFSMILARANSDDRQAFEQLAHIQSDQNHPYQDMARQVIKALRATITTSSVLSIEIPWKEGRSIKDIPYSKLSAFYERAEPIYRPALLNQIWENADYTEEQRITFMIDVIKKASSLRELDAACSTLNKKAEINKNFIASEEYINWWDRYRTNQVAVSSTKPTLNNVVHDVLPSDSP